MSLLPRAITSGEETYLRTDKQHLEIGAVISVPNTIYTARLNGVPSSNDMVLQIDYDGGVGTLGDVKVDMEMWVGSTSGGREYGVCRIRKTPTASIFYIGEVADIDWTDDAYLTIVDMFPIRARHILIDNTEEVYMDGDVAYSDQHNSWDPIVNLGCPAVLELTGADVQCVITSVDSTVIGSSISSQSWEAPGASSTALMTTVAPTIKYDTPGQYMIYCTVTAANGKSYFGARRVYVIQGASPHKIYDITNFVGSLDTGGWKASLTFKDTDVFDQAQVILYAKDYYGSTQTSLGQIPYRENILLVGWVDGESIEYNFDQGTVQFDVQGPQYWLDKIPGYISGLEHIATTADAWTNIPAMTVDKALFHLLHWRSTMMRSIDVSLTSDDRVAAELQGAEGSLWGQIIQICAEPILAAVCVDRFGRFYAFLEPQLVASASRTWATIRTLDEQDIADCSITRAPTPEYARVALSGVRVISRVSGEAYFSLSPGHTFKHYGTPTVVDNLLLNTQAQANTLAGLITGWHNNEFPEILIQLTGMDRMIDICPSQFIDLGTSLNSNPRGLTLTDVNIIPREITYDVDLDDATLIVTVVGEAETFPELNIDGDIPYAPPPPPWPDVPPLPPPPPIVPPPPGEPPTTSVSDVVVCNYGQGVFLTSNFGDFLPDWYPVNGGIDSADIPYIDQLEVTPSGAIYVSASVHQYDTHDFSLYYAPQVGAAFTKLLDHAGALSILGAGSIPIYTDIGVDKTSDDHACVIISEQGYSGGYDGKLVSFVAGVQDSVTTLTYSTGYFFFCWNSRSRFANGEWYYACRTKPPLTQWTEGILATTEGGSTRQVYNAATSAAIPSFWMPNTLDTIYFGNFDNIKRFDDGTGPATITVYVAPGNYWRYICSDPTGQYLLKADQGGITLPTYSDDYGATWSACTGLATGPDRVIANDGNPDHWLICHHDVLYSEDGKDGTWTNKIGNLALQYGTPQISDVEIFGNA